MRTTIESHIVKLQIGNIFKHVNLPAFDARNPKHLELAQAVYAAHSATVQDKWHEANELASAVAEAIIADTISDRET